MGNCQLQWEIIYLGNTFFLRQKILKTKIWYFIKMLEDVKSFHLFLNVFCSFLTGCDGVEEGICSFLPNE